MPDKQYISKITLPNGQTYDIKDQEARDLIEQISAAGLKFKRSVDAATTPVGVIWYDDETQIVGTLTASAADHSYIYMVPDSSGVGKSTYFEYITLNEGSDASPAWVWELLGSTDIDIDDLGDLAYLDSVNFNQGTKDIVLGESTTFTNSSSSVTFTGGTNDTFVKSYPGATSKLETATIKGVGTDITFNAVSADPGTVTATNTTFGTATKASKIVTEEKTATYVDWGTATKASKATAGTAVTLAKPASAATSVSYIGNSETSSIIASASVTNETLSFGTASVTQASVTGINGSQSITPYTFADVTVPVVTSTSEVTVASVKTNTDITVPVVSSNTPVTASGAITLASKTAATSAANATTVATGSLKSNDAVGATVMTGLGTATTASAVTSVGTGTAAAQSITVGTNDKVEVAVYGTPSITVTSSN